MTENANAGTRLLYETVADTYAQIVADETFEPTIDLALITDFATQLSGRGEVRVLDAGCGTGRMTRYVTTLNAAIVPTGVDLSPAMLKHAKATNPEVAFEEADLRALPFEDLHFDGILAWYCILHTPPHSLPELFAEWVRVLRPGGLILLGYQAGVGELIRANAYGHDIQLHAYLHHTPYVEAALRNVGMTIDTALNRAPRRQERLSQAFILARRP